MTTPAKEDTPPAAMERVYLVGAADVQAFYGLLDDAREAAIVEPGLEVQSLWAAVNHAAEVFTMSRIVKAKFH